MEKGFELKKEVNFLKRRGGLRARYQIRKVLQGWREKELSAGILS